MKKFAVIGGRNFNDQALLERVLLEQKNKIQLLISGGAEGADKMAVTFARKHGIDYEVIRPDYKRYPGRVAPIKRNETIILKADQVIAFWDGESEGTKSAIDFAEKYHRKTQIVSFKPKVANVKVRV